MSEGSALTCVHCCEDDGPIAARTSAHDVTPSGVLTLLCVLRALVKFLKLNFPSRDVRQQSLVPQPNTPGLLKRLDKVQAMNTACFHVSSPDRGRADKAELRLRVVHHICKDGIVVRNLQLKSAKN